MALDPSPDREPGMDARVVCDDPDVELEWAMTSTLYADGFRRWWPLGGKVGPGLTWAELASEHPDATVVLP